MQPRTSVCAALWVGCSRLTPRPLPVKKGDRVAQLILERIVTPGVEEVEDLDDTTRGAGGFGSTGVAAVLN